MTTYFINIDALIDETTKKTEGVTILINYEKVIRDIHRTHETRLVDATFKMCHLITNRTFAEEFGLSAQWDDMVKTGAYSVRVTPSSTIEN